MIVAFECAGTEETTYLSNSQVLFLPKDRLNPEHLSIAEVPTLASFKHHLSGSSIKKKKIYLSLSLVESRIDIGYSCAGPDFVPGDR